MADNNENFALPSKNGLVYIPQIFIFAFACHCRHLNKNNGV